MDKQEAIEILTAREVGLTAREWKRMYIILLRGIDRALDALPVSGETRAATHFLRKALDDAEDYYITAVKTGEI